MNAAISFFILFMIQLFFMVDPIGLTPVFVSMTASNSQKEKLRMLRTGIFVALIILLLFVFFSQFIMDYFGLSVSSIKIGGGLLLGVIGAEMIYGSRTKTSTNTQEEELAKEQEDVAVTPLGVPLLAGPGAILTVILFSGQATTLADHLAIFTGVIIVMIASLLIVSKADYFMSKIGPIGTKVAGRFMGLIIVFMSVQMVIDGIKALI